jgi:hypothetical protein
MCHLRGVDRHRSRDAPGYTSLHVLCSIAAVNTAPPISPIAAVSLSLASPSALGFSSRL